MTPPLGERVWVFHSGALGDHVMIWPLVRALARQGTAVAVVAPSSHARLCAGEIGRQCAESSGSVHGLGVEQPRFTRMWSGETDKCGCVERQVGTVVSFVADRASDGGRLWIASAQSMFPGAKVVCVGPPRSASRMELWARAGVNMFGSVASFPNSSGPTTLFAGAGGEAKRWPVERWVALAAAIGAGPRAPKARLISGPVEAEKWSNRERGAFDEAEGVVLGRDGDLAPLADAIRGSRLFIGCDTGPTHLSAQLGLPTIALFGPTDPGVWTPVGPRVRVLAPESPRGMDWLGVDRVLREQRMLAGGPSRITSAG